MPFHIVKEQDGKTFISEHEYPTRLSADKQVSALNDELDGEGVCYVLDDAELWALMYAHDRAQGGK